MLERMNTAGTFASSFRNELKQPDLTGVSHSFAEQDIKQAKAKHDLVALVGSRVKLTRYGNELKGQCPFHNGHVVSSLSVDPEKGTYHCPVCGARGDALTWLMQMEHIGFRQVMEISLRRPVKIPLQQREFIKAIFASASPASSDEFERQRKKELARKIWEQSLPAAQTLVETYLFTRGLVFDVDLPESLRFHPNLLHEPSRQYHPAMISLVCDNEGKFCGIHRTYLAPDGADTAEVMQGGVKRMLGTCFGAHVRISAGSQEKVAIAEDIETALSIAQSCPDLTVWASMVLGNLKAPVPSSFPEVILCADSKNKDPHMAERIVLEAAREHKERGHKVLVARAPRGMDFNDILLTGQDH